MRKNDEKRLKNSYCGQTGFQNVAKSCDRHALVDIHILCKFGEFMFINKGDVKDTHRWRVFYNLASRAYRPVGDNTPLSDFYSDEHMRG